ncbi:MAG: helix-turn-helix domain-containing protein [Armatimonadetes bacterium]|nr:helix-turn-helix domain-containing protein [Armatimonadota bacterium]
MVHTNSGYAVIEGVSDPLVDGFLVGLGVNDKGYKVRREHGSSQWIFVLSLTGCGFYNDGSGARYLPPGSALLIPPSVYHEYGVADTHQRWEEIWVHIVDGLIEPTIMDWSGALHKATSCELDEGAFRKTEAEMRECLDLSRSLEPHDHHLASALLTLAIARCRHQVAVERGQCDMRIETVKSIISGNLAQANRVTDLARAVNISPSRLTQLFHQELGMTPQDYVERERLARAARLLLQSDMTLSEIAKSTGFANEFYFSRRFKMAHAVSPGRYRKSGGATVQ